MGWFNTNSCTDPAFETHHKAGHFTMLPPNLAHTNLTDIPIHCHRISIAALVEQSLSRAVRKGEECLRHQQQFMSKAVVRGNYTAPPVI